MKEKSIWTNCIYAFKDESCGYAGPDGECDKTAESCARKGNFQNFGGWRKPTTSHFSSVDPYSHPGTDYKDNPDVIGVYRDEVQLTPKGFAEYHLGKPYPFEHPVDVLVDVLESQGETVDAASIAAVRAICDEPMIPRSLLKKYMQHVIDCEGITFLDHIHKYNHFVQISPAEEADLREIEQELSSNKD